MVSILFRCGYAKPLVVTSVHIVKIKFYRQIEAWVSLVNYLIQIINLLMLIF